MLTARGSVGILRVGYQWAADVTAWSWQTSHEAIGAPVTRATVTLGRSDVFWLTQQPLMVAFLMGPGGWWRWPVLAMTGSTAQRELVLDGAPTAQGAG